MMPRYLTPPKLTLLLLTDLYISSDQIASTSKLNVLSFIASQINTPSDYDDNNIEESVTSSTTSSDITAFSESLSQSQSTIPGRSVYDILLQRVWDLDGLDSLFALFQQLNALITPSPAFSEEPRERQANIVPPKISKASPLGQFVRRCGVEFTRLQLFDGQTLWEAFASHRGPSYETWASRNPDAAKRQRQRHADDNPAWATSGTSKREESGDNQTSNYTSTADTTNLLTFSISRLQNLGSRVPASLKSRLQDFLSTSTSGTESLPHFLSFFDHWRAGQYTSALESLHRYFDYSLISQAGNGNGGDGRDGQGGMRGLYQYALLHLSVLHADFGHWEAAGESMEECIATARENNDTQCLNFALSSLLYLRQAHPTGTTAFSNLFNLLGGSNEGNDEITFLKAKARETRNWSLLSSTLLEEAKVDMHASGGDSGGMTKALECILQAEYLNTQHDLRTLMPAARMFHASGFDRLGQAALSTRIYESIPIIHPTNHLPINDRVRVSCRVAYSLAQTGRYDDAMHMLESVGKGENVKGVLKLKQKVLGFGMLVQLKKSLHENDLEAATHNLHNLQPLRSFGDPEIVFVITLLEIEVLLAQHQYQKALSNVNKQIAELKRNPGTDVDTTHQLHFMLVKCRIFAAGGQAIKGFSIALRAAVVADRLLLVSALTEAIGVLTAILIELSEFEAAKDLVEGMLPFALEGRDLHVTARLSSQLAEAYVGVAGTCELDSSEQSQNLRTAEGYVERSFEAYARLSDLSGMLDTLSMKSRLARWKDDEATAKQADEKWLQLLADSPAERKRMGKPEK